MSDEHRPFEVLIRPANYSEPMELRDIGEELATLRALLREAQDELRYDGPGGRRDPSLPARIAAALEGK